MSGKPVLPPPCLAYGEAGSSHYGYRPSLAAGIIFVIIFGSYVLGHAYQTWRTRTLWLLFFVVGSGLECLGWVARLVSYHCAYSRPLFTMQTAVLIMGPAWTQSGIYITLWVLISILGRGVSPLPPSTYLLICLAVDVVCLAAQATGGGLAGSEFTDGKSTQPGTTTMTVGIIAQLVSTFLFSILLGIVCFRALPQLRSQKPLGYVAAATILATFMMIVRGIYRSIELTQGWRGYLITHQRYTIGLDAIPMVFAMGVYVFVNPAALFIVYKKAVSQTAGPTKGVHGSSESGSGSQSPVRKPEMEVEKDIV